MSKVLRSAYNFSRVRQVRLALPFLVLVITAALFCVLISPVGATITTGAAGLPRYANYPAPPGLGEKAGEPSIGVNWKTERMFSNSMFSIPNGGTTMYYGGFLSYALKVTFDDCPSPANATWEKKQLPTASAPRALGDPILFTDHQTGRTFVSQLIGGTPLGSTTDITDDDGDTFMLSEGSGLPSNIDHQTFGGGPYHIPAPPGAGALGYQNAVYYCSQSVADAACSISLDGGRIFGPAIPMFTISDCDGLHGHIKVGADGTAYVPNKGCGGPAPLVLGNEQASIIVTEDNSVTWKIRPIPHPTEPGHENDNLTKGDDDPSVGVASDGTIYLGYQSLDGHPRIAVSHDKGITWSRPYDVGAQVVNGGPVLNTTFPAVVAGDGQRAAFAFYGSETGGDNYACGEGDDCSDALGNNPNIFTGAWYLYIASTFDGGQTWTTQNVTPGDPVQRGGICSDGTCRNQLDFFDATIDKEGRVLVGWDDGCVGGCVNGGANSFTAKATITRQSGGKRMFAAFDPVEPVLPGAPKGAGIINRAGTATNLSWSAPDDGGAAITAYRIYRTDGAGGSFNLVGTVSDTNFSDTTFPAPATSNSYRLTAVNSQGEGPYCSAFTPVPDSNETECLTPGLTKLTDAAGDTSAALGVVTTPAPPGSDLLSFQIAQPYAADGVAKLVFTINTNAGQSPQVPGSAWYVAMRIVSGATTRYKGVHMAWNGTTPIFESYTPAPNNAGGVDGRFVTVGSQKAAEPGSSYAAPYNKVIIVVKASDLGLNPGDLIDGFVSAVSQSTDPGATVGRGATALYDEMLDGLGFTGTYIVNDGATCPSPTPTPTPTPASFAFSPSVKVFDPAGGAQTGSEPSIELDANDNIYTTVASARLWRSNNGGANWKFLGAFDTGGDGDLEFDASNRLYACALVIGQGLTSTVDRFSNPATMTSVTERDFKTNTYPLQDRQWLATYGNDIVYLGFHDIGPENVYVTKSIDGGQSFGPPVPVITDPVLLLNTIPNTNDGRVLVDKNSGAVYIAFAASTPQDNATTPPFGPHRKLIAARSFDGGASWQDSVIFEGPEGTAVANIFPAFAIDTSGNLYMVFSANLDSNRQLTPTGTLNIFYTRSIDRGETWSTPIQVNNTVGSHVLPWAVAGCAGKVDIVWYGTSAVGNPNTFPASGADAPDWQVYFAQTLDGLGATPTFEQGQVSDHVIHKGQIATGGLTGQLAGADRRLADFFEVDYDSTGMAHIVWADTGTSPTAAANVYYAKQTIGASVLGCAAPPPTPTPTPTPAPGSDGPQVFQGTYDPNPYPCATQRHHFNVPSGKSRIVVQVNATVPTNDLSVSLLFGSDPNPVPVQREDTGTCCEALIYQPADGVPAGEYQVQICQTPTPQGVPQNPPYDYTGVFIADGTGAGNATPTPTPVPLPTPVPIYEKGGITFSPNVSLRASVAGKDGEPSLRVDKFGNAYVAGIRGVPAGVDLWYFDLNPNSATYDPLMRNPIYRGQPDQFSPDESVELGGDGGGDVDLAVGFDSASPGSPPYLAFSSLTAANISSARSTDRGATFTKNPAGNVTGGVPADDRQWMEFYGNNSVYLLYRSLAPVIAWVQRSNDGGLTYGTAREVGTIGQVGGISVDQNDGTVYVSGANGVVAVGTPLMPGMEPLTYTTHNVVGAGNANIFFTVKAARDGTVYACYSDDTSVFIRYSKDKGNTWSQAIRVSDGPETATSVLPWMETGPTPGSVGVVWYGTTASSNNDNADWKVFFAQSLNATDANPVFRQVALSDHFIHGSNISEEGLPLLPGEAPNRNLLDYFQIGFDPTGAAVVAYTDDHNDFDGHVYVARQISGRGAGGTDIPAPVEGNALPPVTPRDPNGPQVVDFPQDQRNGLLTVLPVNDPLDILSIKYTTEGSAAAPVLVATMKVSDLSLVPPLSNWRINFTANAPDSRLSPTGDYSFGLSDRGDQFFLRATTDALGNPTYTYGTAVREHQHRGLIAYTDRGAADSGTINSLSGTITMKIALSKLNAALVAGHTPLAPGSILAGLRGGAYTTGDDNAADRNDRAKSDIARGGTQYAINSAPTAVLTANPTSGNVPLTVNFDGSGSTDPDAGDRLTYTFDFGDGSAFMQNSPMIVHQYNQVGTFTASLKVKDSTGFESNPATVVITVNTPPPPPCIEDDDSRIAYSGGWHLINSASASGGHFRYHTGNSPQHFANLDFSVPSGSTGSITYAFAKSPKGGTADVYLDGVLKQSVNYLGSTGTTQAPEFKTEYKVTISNLSAGAHRLEIKNMSGVVYVDRFCLENSSSNAQPATGPGNTTNQSGSASAGQTSNTNYQMPSGAREISVAAESTLAVPFKLVLVDPSGMSLQTADSVSGIATISRPVTQGGVYVIKVVNLTLGPLQFTVTATPTVQR